MQIDVLTLFPGMIEAVLGESIIGRARDAGLVSIRAINIRDYSENKHRRVDDTPYGGGRGMLMAAPPIYNCYQAAVADAPAGEKRHVVYLSPRGRTFTQKIAKEYLQYDRLVLLCGHYEGIDQRVIDEIVDEELSVGDYVLTGGELPACIVADAVCRLIDGVLPLPECYENESFENLKHYLDINKRQRHKIKYPLDELNFTTKIGKTEYTVSTSFDVSGKQTLLEQFKNLILS